MVIPFELWDPDELSETHTDNNRPKRLAAANADAIRQASPSRWSSPCRGEGAYPLISSNQSGSTRRAQLSVAAKVVRPAHLFNHAKI